MSDVYMYMGDVWELYNIYLTLAYLIDGGFRGKPEEIEQIEGLMAEARALWEKIKAVYGPR